MSFPRRVIAGIALPALALLSGAASSQDREKPSRWARPIQMAFRPDAAIAATVDLRPEIEKFGLAVRDQGNNRGTCSVFATTFLIEFHTARTSNVKNLDLSEEYLNWAKNQANHTDFDGGKFSGILRGYEQFGMVPSRDMPYLPAFNPQHPDTPTKQTIAAGRKFQRFPFIFIKRWNDQRGMSEQELAATRTLLRAGHPVATGIWWLQDFETVTVNHVPLLKEYPRKDNNNSDASKNPMFDGHSIDLVGFHEGPEFPGGGYFIFRNSFGTAFGHDGYGFVSFQYLRNYSNDAIYITP